MTTLITDAAVNVTGMYTFFLYVQEVTKDWFFLAVLFALFIILFVIFRGASGTNSKPFSAASFFVMVMSILFRTLGFIQNRWMYLFISFVAVGAVWMHLEGSQS